MDPDEALARLLQEEELRAAQELQAQLRLQQQRQQPGAQEDVTPDDGLSGGTGQFRARLHDMLNTALRCEDKALQERARAVMPLERLRVEAAEGAAIATRLGPDVMEAGNAGGGGALASPSAEDLLAKALLRWFKTEFFTWVDTLPCSRCGSRATAPGGAVQPLPDDLAAGAARVELHRCSACGGATRFPRYNDPGKLLQPGCRRGRCGEWANAFLLCCRAAGLTARYVSDWADHVWTEYYSHSMRRWVHLDSCEASYDQPLLYESGWGKSVSYVVAAGVYGMVDVTLRYTARWRPDVLHLRTLVPERWLGRQLDEMTTALRAGWTAPRRMLWLGRDVVERVELVRHRVGVRPTGHAAGGHQHQLPGRQTGSLEWRQQRGETGAVAAAGVIADASSSVPAARPPTSYRWARDGPEELPAVFAAAGRLSGGACRAAGHNETAEVVERLFDGRVDTKWLDFGGAGRGGNSWVEYRIPVDQQALVLVEYELVSANDCPERDPAAWLLEAVTDADFSAGRHDVWTPLDHRIAVRFPDRHSPLAFRLPAPSPPCRRLRLSISATADPRVANSVQLACWNLYGVGPNGGCSDERRLQGLRDTVAAATQEAASAAAKDGRPPSTTGKTATAACAGAYAAALQLLGRLLDNIQREPKAPRFRKVRCVKVAQLLDSSSLADLLQGYLRFRPLIAPAPAAERSSDSNAGSETSLRSGFEPRRGVPEGHDVFLVLAMDPTGEDLRRISEATAILRS